MILVAGGSGVLGRRVVTRLVERGEPVRVLTRDPTRATHLPDGVQVVVGDLVGAPLDPVVEGCRTVVSAVHGLIGPSRTSPELVDRDGNARLVGAATRAGVDHFVLVSGVGAAPDHPMSLHRMKYAAEQDLQASGLRSSTVRATSFLETWLGIVGAKIRSGGPALVLGRGRNPINFVSADDVAAFVCLAVARDPLIGEQVSVGGPQDLTFTEIAEHLLAGVSEAPRTRHVPQAALRAVSVLARPVNPALARMAQAALVMDTTDMTFDATPVRQRFPDVPATTMASLAAQSRAALLRPGS